MIHEKLSSMEDMVNAFEVEELESRLEMCSGWGDPCGGGDPAPCQAAPDTPPDKPCPEPN